MLNRREAIQAAVAVAAASGATVQEIPKDTALLVFQHPGRLSQAAVSNMHGKLADLYKATGIQSILLAEGMSVAAMPRSLLYDNRTARGE